MTRGLFHKTLWIRKLRICNYGQILTVNLLVNCQNSVIYGHFVVNYLEKSFMEQAPGLTSVTDSFNINIRNTHSVTVDKSPMYHEFEIFMHWNFYFARLLNFARIQMWWWPNGRRARLLFCRSKFDSRWNQQLFNLKNWLKRTKIDYKGSGDFPFKNLKERWNDGSSF